MHYDHFFYRSYVFRHTRLRSFVLLILGGRRSFIDPTCCSFLHGFAHVSKVGFVHPTFSLICESSTWRLDSCPLGDTWYGVILWVFEFIVWVLKQSEWVFYSRASLFVAPYWRAIKMAKQLSTATTLLCFGFFWCRVDVLQSIFSRSTISFAEFSGTSQAVSSRPTEVHG